MVAGGRAVHAREPAPQVAHAAGGGGLELEMLQHNPASGRARAVADGLGDAHGLRFPDLIQSGRFRSEHFCPRRRIELDEVGAPTPSNDMTLVDAAATDSRAGFDGKGRAGRLADRALDVPPRVHSQARSGPRLSRAICGPWRLRL